MERKTKTWIGKDGAECSDEHPNGAPITQGIESLQCQEPDEAHKERRRMRLAGLINQPIKRRRKVGQTVKLEAPWPGQWRRGSP